VLPYRGNYLDLDPTYRDAYGLPLLRMTFDWRDNELKMSNFVTDQAEKIMKAMGPSQYKVNRRTGQYNIVPYQTTHNTGGAIMGSDPGNSVVNKYQQSWDVPNLFVVGASAFPQNSSNNPTDTVGALAYYTADAIKNHYVKKPGPLA
jgi:gluconate 2-dehydrogenase alpha chain